MSIFRETFTPTVKDQLTQRQKSLRDRSPQSIIQLNSRNSWIRMTSSVNVDGKNTLAKQYILQGGVLLNNKLRAGVGNADAAYSGFTPSLKSYNNPNLTAGTAGIKPMPGITSIDIKSKTAYGSLREVTVNFKCNNIQQLEDLELIYMRPGYTVLIEWGWAPFLDNSGKPKYNINFYDGVINGGVGRDQIFKDLYNKTIEHSSNYDAMLGYVKNYNWSARMDGGYDCQTTIISIGEILESLKINWLPSDSDTIDKQQGLISPNTGSIREQAFNASKESAIKAGVAAQDNTRNVALELSQQSAKVFLGSPEYKKYFNKNILAGMCYEIYFKCKTQQVDKPYKPLLADYDLFGFQYNIGEIPDSLAKDGAQIYITLGSFVNILNNYVLLAASTDGKTPSTPLIKLSVQPNEYDTSTVKDAEGNPENSLLCLAHPLQVSVDPTICLITNNIWAGGFDTSGIDDGAGNGTVGVFDGSARAILSDQNSSSAFTDDDPIGTRLLNDIKPYSGDGSEENRAKDFIKSYAKAYFNNKKVIPNATNSIVYAIEAARKLGELYNNVGKLEERASNIYKLLFDETTCTSIIQTDIQNKLSKDVKAGSLAKTPQSPYAVNYLQQLQNQGKVFEYKEELGKISNIYLNVDYLYRLSINPEIQDQKTQEIRVYQYLKQVLKGVQDSIGGVNSFDIHVDPIDSVARIIDLNYVDANPRSEAYKNAFPLEAANISGSVRSYTLSSQIFPEQSAMVAIGAQVGGGGEQGYQNNTLLDFNNNLEDRVIPKKVTPTKSLPAKGTDASTLIVKLKSNFSILQESFFPQVVNDKNEQAGGKNNSSDQNLASSYKVALKEVIAYFQGVADSNTKNRSIIPVKMSITMDGIGGLIIGHLFKFPPSLLPRGYKNEGNVGSKLLQTVTGIGHKVENGDWTTTIDAYNIIVSDPKGEKTSFSDFLTKNPVTGETSVSSTVSSKPYNNTSAAVNFLLHKGYKDYQVAAIVGTLIQESGINPTSSLTDSTGSTLGIAQWRGPRLSALKQKTGFDTLNVQLNFILEEFVSGGPLEVKAGTALKNASTFGDAVVAMARYERFYPRDYTLTFENLSRDYSRRVSLSQDVLNRIKNGEFK